MLLKVDWLCLYRFNYNATFTSPCDLSDGPEWGVPHGAELSLVFGAPTYLTNPSVSCKFTPTDQKVANAVGKLWADFAANRSSGYWPLYHDQSQQEMLIDEDCEAQPPALIKLPHRMFQLLYFSFFRNIKIQRIQTIYEIQSFERNATLQ